MFDWNDEELADIIWGEAKENDDHIVPYPNESEQKPLASYRNQNNKQWNQDIDNVQPAETKALGVINDYSGSKGQSDSHFHSNEGLPAAAFDPWPPDLSLPPNAACSKGYASKNDPGSMGTEESNDLTGLTSISSTEGKMSPLDNDVGIFQNEHGDKECDDFLEYGWANIGSFDDLDRMFRNDDPIFGHESLGNADELWSSSSDVLNSPEKSFPLSMGSPQLGLGVLGNGPEHYDMKTEFVPHDDKSLSTICGTTSDPSSHGLNNLHVNGVEVSGKQCYSSVKLEYAGGKSNPSVEEKVNKQRKQLKFQKKEEQKVESKFLQDLHGNWSSVSNQFQQIGNQFSTSTLQTFPSSVLGPQKPLGGPESLRYLHPSQSLLPSDCANPSNLYPVMPILPYMHPDQDKHQSTLSACEFSPRLSKQVDPLQKSSNAHAKSLTMTPKEKIEKLRRRQQMRAMLAIQKQQQHFGHQVTQTFPPENQSKNQEATNIEVEENLNIIPSLEPYSPIEQHNSKAISMVIDGHSLEETILDQLQDVIGKLDIRIRLCIRDSLFRLAQSAMQRHNASDTSSINTCSMDENKVIAKEETDSRNSCSYDRICDPETETNPIDRTVAHLLFHRPLDSYAKLVDSTESLVSDKLPFEYKTADAKNLSMRCLPNNCINKQDTSYQESKTPCALTETQHGNLFQTSPYINTSEHASNNEQEDAGAMEVEASQ